MSGWEASRVFATFRCFGRAPSLEPTVVSRSRNDVIDPWRIEMLAAIIPVARSTSSRMIGCPFCGRCAQDRQTAVLRSARARGRKGGRPFKMTAAKLRLAMAAMGQQETKIGELCKELSITRQTLYRHVSPKGELRPDGLKLLSHS